MVLRERIELSASPLPRECSTTELPQRDGQIIRLSVRGGGLTHHRPRRNRHKAEIDRDREIDSAFLWKAPLVRFLLARRSGGDGALERVGQIGALPGEAAVAAGFAAEMA